MSTYIKIDGIDGECADDKHEKWIDVLSWSWGMSQSANSHMGGGGGNSLASVQDMSLVKFVDKSTPQLMFASLKGKHIPKAEFHVVKAGGDDKLQYIVAKFEDLIISNVSTGGSREEDRLTEQVSLNFAKVEFEYTEQDAKGGAGAKPKVQWDIKKGDGSVS
ncbi:MAG: type VI secretion system tube protein Hcp [Gammaproteobacteria bacterium]|nr:type VI secretion system tube protein Hcp [Gammaproteobacteria bacterium]